MKVNVAQLLKEPIGSSRDWDIRGEEADSGIQLNGRVRLLRTDRGILVSGKISTRVDILCSRCLTHIEYPLDLDIEEEYFPTIDVSSGTPLPLPEDDGFPIGANHILDLGEVVRQYILLATPMKPLCRDECQGLCPQCGENLNYGPCSCKPPVDQRWVKLEGKDR